MRLQLRRSVAIGLMAGALAGCNTLDRLSAVGEQPPMMPVMSPTEQPGYRPVSLPMPAPVTAERQPNSLWRPGARHFFRDQRANRVGDILTVVVTIADEAQVQNQTTRTRDGGETLGIPSILGFETELSGWLPKAFDPSNAVSLESAHNTAGSGEIDRQEEVSLRVAAVVTQVLPNGNLVIYGRQEVRVNFEVREILIGGIIRPEDIGPNNEISHDKIAEARIAYGGRGQLTDLQQPRYGQQILDILLPF